MVLAKIAIGWWIAGAVIFALVVVANASPTAGRLVARARTWFRNQ